MPVPKKPSVTPRLLLRDQVYDRILNAIVSGEFEPGRTLSDKELEVWLGASRTPIREALGRLANTGLVEVQPQKATRVAEIDPVQFGEMMEVLGALYAAAIREVVPLLTDADRKKLTTLLKKLVGPAGRKAEQAPVILTEIFEVYITRYDNRVLLRQPARFDPHVQRILRTHSDRISRTSTYDAIREMVEATLAGDALEASRAASRYFASEVSDFHDQILAANAAAPALTSAPTEKAS
ncbi:GntR family transcriptional regulator [Mycetocola lacteus]|uniref:GntR family transcriptional regulator n=1 Tax=Mycetocola lacteus TaxID=76637 RepID=A0A3L7AY04_9MICO|nr:GntR family transcriptional regulator [Mycetocola lacteus]RLP80655.1 GntR family transcriptional regulator [Mycetocola lacteus]RLP84440.1 GntR family transcriptional regulator [Mycetocola lacteus]